MDERFELQSSPLKAEVRFMERQTVVFVFLIWTVTDGWILCLQDTVFLEIRNCIFIGTMETEHLQKVTQTFLGVNDSSCGICDLNNDGLPIL